MSAVADHQQSRFVRRTTLQEDEYRKNFRQIDRDVIEVLKSAEAKRVTPLIGTLYLTLIDAPSEYWEREGVLRFIGEVREGKPYTAWQQLMALLDCGNSTAKKALDWMHEQGIIGYFAGKNGVGIRIFINRAASSIGRREQQKNLHLVRTPTSEPRTPTIGTPFKVCSLDVQDSDEEFRAPKSGAEFTKEVNASSNSTPNPASNQQGSETRKGREAKSLATNIPGVVSIDEIVSRLRGELEPCVRTAAVQAAAREHERTREWLDEQGIPKATRVAQHEAYKVLKNHGLINDAAARRRAEMEVGLSHGSYMPKVHLLSADEVTEAAGMCVALLETQGKPIDTMLAELSAESGGWVLAEDAPKVRAAAEALLLERSGRR